MSVARKGESSHEASPRDAQRCKIDFKTLLSRKIGYDPCSTVQGESAGLLQRGPFSTKMLRRRVLTSCSMRPCSQDNRGQISSKDRSTLVNINLTHQCAHLPERATNRSTTAKRGPDTL
jgi:hypothetical protein